MTRPRDRARAARAIEEFLRAMGHEPEGELAGTGERVADAWDVDLLAGEGVDLATVLRQGAIELGDGPHGLVGLRGVDVASMCPHHLLPSHGRASIAYVPGRHAAGLGTIAQMIHAAARRLVLQETLGADVAEALVEGLGARGALCRLELVHTCLSARGERQAAATVDTIAFAGTIARPGEDRSAALAWLGADASGRAAADGSART
jgi:GTP cyclohydrolase I